METSKDQPQTHNKFVPQTEGEKPKYPPVEIVELSGDMPEKVVVGNTIVDRKVDFGLSLKDYLDGLREYEKGENKYFLLSWEGDLVPYGAVIDNQEITYARSGRIMSGLHNVGHYERLWARGGPNKNEQCILITVKKDKQD